MQESVSHIRQPGESTGFPASRLDPCGIRGGSGLRFGRQSRPKHSRSTRGQSSHSTVLDSVFPPSPQVKEVEHRKSVGTEELSAPAQARGCASREANTVERELAETGFSDLQRSRRLRGAGIERRCEEVPGYGETGTIDCRRAGHPIPPFSCFQRRLPEVRKTNFRNPIPNRQVLWYNLS